MSERGFANLLIPEHPLILLPSLAVEVGLNEAVFLQQLFYWSLKKEPDENGDVWIYNTHEEWQEQFPFWSERTIRRLLRELEQAGHIKSAQPEGTHRRKHYALNRQSARFQAAKLAGSNGADWPDVSNTETSTETSTTNGRGEVEEIREHFISTFNPRSKTLDAGQRKIIQDALSVATVEEVKSCLTAAEQSDWHQKRGQYADRQGQKQRTLTAILKPKRASAHGNGYTQRERIDFWLNKLEPDETPKSPRRSGLTVEEENREMMRWQNGEIEEPWWND